MAKKHIILFCISVFVFITCEKKNGALNRKNEFFDKLAVNSLLFSTATPDNLLTTTLIDNPNFYTDSARTVLLGNYIHPTLGDTKTSFYAGLQLRNQLTEKIAQSTIDSVRLYLAYSSDTLIYGVAAKDAKIDLNIFSLKEKLKPVTEKRYSYTDNIDIDQNITSWLENTGPIVLNPKDSVEITLKGEKRKYPPILIVPIKNDLGQKIFDAAKNPEKPITPDILSDLLKGFVFQANNDDSGIATLNIQNPLSVLRIFYKDEKGDQNYYDLSLYSPNTKSRYFTNVDRKKASDLNNVGAFQGSGLGMKVDISALKKEAALTKKVINQAVLYVYLQDNTSEERPVLPASILGVYSSKKTDATETFSLIPFPGYLPFQTNYNKEKNRYELYMTAYIQTYLVGEKMDDELFFFPNILSAYSSILDLPKMELKITYSDFKQ